MKTWIAIAITCEIFLILYASFFGYLIGYDRGSFNAEERIYRMAQNMATNLIPKKVIDNALYR
jgi:hypothetical protein